MTVLALLLFAAAGAFGLARWIGLPAVPLLLLAGLLLSGTGLLEAPALEEAVVLGATFLVFAAGVELDLDRVGGGRRAAIQVGLAQFALLGGAGLVAALALGFEPAPALYLAVALTASSTLVGVRLLQQRAQVHEPFGRLVLGVLLVQDMAVILLMPLLAGPSLELAAVATSVAAVAGLAGLAWAARRWLVEPAVLRSGLDEEGLLVALLAYLFLFAAVSEFLGLPWIAGAFLAGVSLSAFPVSGLVRGQLRSLSDFFLAVFFTALGGLLARPTPEQLWQAAALALLVVLVTPPLVTALAERSGLSARAAIESGLLLSQTSEFSLIFVLGGLAAARVDSHVFTVVALVTVATMVATPFLATERVAWRLMHLHPTRHAGIERTPASGHVLFLGCGDNMVPLLETLVALGQEVVVVDDDPVTVERLRRGDISCLRGDASDPAVLEAAGARRARLIVSTVRRTADNRSALELTGSVPVVVRTFDPEAAEEVRRRGGTPVLYSEAAAEDFLEWFDREVAEVG